MTSNSESGKVFVKFTEDIDFWNESTLFENFATDATEIYEYVFTSKENARDVEIVLPTTMVDDKGNESVEPVIRTIWNRELAKEVNFENFQDIALVDPHKFFNVSTFYSINPGIYNAVDSKYTSKMPNGQYQNKNK